MAPSTGGPAGAALLNVANLVAPGDQREPRDSSFYGWNHVFTAFATINKGPHCSKSPKADSQSQTNQRR